MAERKGERTRGQGSIPHYEVAVIGVGSGGLALANELLKAGVNDFAIVGKPKSGKRRDRKRPDYGGALATYDIPANSQGDELLLAIDKDSLLGRVNRSRHARRLRRMKDTAPNLKRRVGPYLRRVGRELERQKPGDIIAAEVSHSVWDGEKHTVFDAKGNALLTADIISANPGADEVSLAEVNSRFVPYSDKIHGSLDIMQGPGRKKIKKELKKKPKDERFLVVVGGSHTAFTDAAIFTERRRHVLQRKKIGDLLPDGHLIVAHRGEIKVFAETAEQAVAQGLEPGPVKDIDPSKICEATGRYRRFGGFRGWAKEIYLAWLRGEKPVMHVVELDSIDESILQKATIVQAVGIKGREFPVFDSAGNRYTVQRAEDLDIIGTEVGAIPGVPNMYGGGVAVDVLPPGGKIGGEKEFTGYLHFVAGYNKVAQRQAQAMKEQLDQRREPVLERR